MRFYSTKIQDVLEISTKLFFELHSKIRVIEAEERLNLLKIVENQLWLKSEEGCANYNVIYKESTNILETVVNVIKDKEKEKLKRRAMLNRMKQFENVR